MNDVILAILVVSAAVISLIILRSQRQTRNYHITQSELAGRIAQIAESNATAQAHLSERLQAQERAITKALEDKLEDLTKRVGENLQQSTTKTTDTMAKLQERLAVIDTAQKNIANLSSQFVGLQDILSNKQSRGAFGEVQLQDLVQNALPPSAYEFQVTLGNGKRADCVIHMPNPPGSIVIDAKFPLEGYTDLCAATDDLAKQQASRKFVNSINKHVLDISDRYIIAGETAESALMFLPSEAVYAELHANFQPTVEAAWKKRVWIVSPTTLMATLHTVRAVLKDAQMREQAGLIQKEVEILLADVNRVDQRASNLQNHFAMVEKDLRGLLISTSKVTVRSQKIIDLELDENQEKGSIFSVNNKTVTKDS
ncbi:MAG: DNA recombination protein RmuC [Rhodospirillaceae bacterium]|nr:DNA recombination protein RmuC [Rhodospirillaceae bacterium]